MTKKIILFKLLFFISLSWCQENDFQFRFAPSVDYKITKKLKLGFNYRYALDKNASNFQSSNFQFQTQYKITKKISVEAGYRFSTSFEKDTHRLFGSIMYDYKLKQITLSSRTRYQFSTQRFDADFMNNFKQPSQYIRQKFTVDYNIPKSKASIYFAPEIFVKLDNSVINYHRVRYQLGTDYDLKYGNTVGVSFFYEDRYNTTKTDRWILTAKYNLSIDELVKKKKKKKE